MDRRQFLTVGMLTGLSLLTGCTSDSEGSSSQDSEQAQEHMDQASTALERAADEMESESNKFTGSDFESGGVDIKTAEIDGYLDTASTELDEAERYATGDQLEVIDAARGYISYAKGVTDFMDTFADGYSQAYSGFTYIQSDRYEDAVSELETAESTLLEANDHLTVTQDRYGNLNTDILDELDAVRVESTASTLDDLDQLVPAYQALVEGMKYLSQGMIDFTEGRDQMENSQYSEAKASFGRASEDFSRSRSTFQAEEESAPSNIKSTFIELTCYSTALRDASDSLEAAIEAYQNRNQDRANTKVEEAREATNRCDFSSS